jgi:hypothetical protein
MRWLYGMYNEKEWLRAADGYVNQSSIEQHEKQTGEKLVWMTTGNWADPSHKDTFFKLQAMGGTSIYGRRRTLVE